MPGRGELVDMQQFLWQTHMFGLMSPEKLLVPIPGNNIRIQQDFEYRSFKHIIKPRRLMVKI
jgi:hypothetical protein